MESVVRDLRAAVRSWRRSLGPIGAAVAALALAIGANTAVFSIVDGVLLRPLPYEDPSRLVMVWQDLRARGGPQHDWISPGLFVEWQRRATMFDAIAAVRGWAPNLTGIDQPERLRGAAVSPAYFTALGVRPVIGRTLTDEDDAPNGPPVVVLSDAVWARIFNRDPHIVGRAIQLDDVATTVVGVMPATFEPPIIDAEVWAPIRIDPASAPRGIIVLRVLAKVRPGLTIGQAQAGMSGVAAALEHEDPEWEHARVAVVPLRDDIVGDARQLLVVLSLAVTLVLGIACVNVMSLLLARAAERSREMTIRAALGAGRWHILRQLIVESGLLAGIGGTLGLLLAFWMVHALVAVAPASAPRMRDVRIDALVLAFSAAITVLTAIVAGAAPAAAAVRAQLTPGLRDGGREHTGTSRTRAVLVMTEIAIALVLVVGAALLIRTLLALQAVDMGFQVDHALTASIAPPRTHYRGPAALRQFYAGLLQRAGAIPGVQSAAITNVLPLSPGDMILSFEIEGRPPAPAGTRGPVAGARIVSPSYVHTMGMRVLEGRDLTRLDSDNAPGAVLVNDTMARKFWGTASPIGARLDVGPLEATVVGVVNDVHQHGPGAAPAAEMLIPFTQFPAGQATIVLRTTVDPSSAAASLRAAMREIDPSLPLANVVTLESLMDRSVAQPRFLAALLSGFAVLAAVLALVGVYGLLSFSVSRRTRELGVRMALGAGRARLVRLVLGQSLTLAVVGLAIGSVLALTTSRVLAALLFGVRPGDPATVFVMAAAIAVATVAASVPPALRAARVDPVVALREE